jgi:hypothetical protein
MIFLHFCCQLSPLNRIWEGRMASSRMWSRVVFLWTYVSEDRIASIFRVEKSVSEEPMWASSWGLSCQLKRSHKNYTTPHPRKRHSSWWPPWKPQILHSIWESLQEFYLLGPGTTLLGTCLYAAFLLDLFFDPENGGEIFLRNVGWLSTDYTALYLRRQIFICIKFLNTQHARTNSYLNFERRSVCSHDIHRDAGMITYAGHIEGYGPHPPQVWGWTWGRQAHLEKNLILSRDGVWLFASLIQRIT